MGVLLSCRVGCKKNPFTSGACFEKCEGQFGALSDCGSQTPNPIPKPPEPSVPEPSGVCPDGTPCTFEKWKRGEC